MKKLLYLLVVLLPISFLLAACGTENDSTEEETNKADLTIYTTVYPLQYFAEEIGGDVVHVETIYPPGTDEHTFEPTQKDMIKLADADLFFYVGFGLEGFVEKAKKSLENEKVLMVAAGETIALDEEEGNHDGEETHEHSEGDHEDESNHEGHSHGDIDPHIWIDPVYAKEMAKIIKDTLVERTPENKELYEENFQELATKLDELNTQFIEVANEAKNKKMIVSHGAYGYWEARYGIKQISISGLSSSSEPSQKELENIIKTAKNEEMNYIFFEQNISSNLTEIVQKELKAEPLVLHNLSVRTDDDIKANQDYFSIMQSNIEALKIGLN